MFMTRIKVNEIFGPTIQGEGKSAGLEVMFVRTSTCNLACIWCDTPYTWNWKGTKFKHPDKFNKETELKEMTVIEIFTKLKELGPRIRAVVISGGEPLLQQKELTDLVKLLKAEGYWVEVETNGTIIPTDEFLYFIDQINCSPKTSNSGKDNKLSMRERPEALRKLAKSNKVYFKFVVDGEKDIEEILQLVKEYKMENVFLMPQGRTKNEQLARKSEVQFLSSSLGFLFSPRLHIEQCDTKRGV